MTQPSMDDFLTATARAVMTANELIYEVKLIRDHLESQTPKPKRQIRATGVIIAHLEAEVAAYNSLGAGLTR